MITFDLDNVSEWGPSLSEYLSLIVPSGAGNVLRSVPRKYFEDTAPVLFSRVCDKKEFRDTAQEWFLAQNVAGYHGSRLDEADVKNIQKDGLLSLVANDRKPHLLKKLREYPQSHAQIDEVLKLLGEGKDAGHREGQVHVTFSQSGLVKHFNHYLRYGSEVDQHAAARLVGDQYKTILSSYGKATLITLEVPGPDAFKAANPYGTPHHDELPNPLNDIANVWSNWLRDPKFFPIHGIDSGMMFYQSIPPAWIRSIEFLEDSELDD